MIYFLLFINIFFTFCFFKVEKNWLMILFTIIIHHFLNDLVITNIKLLSSILKMGKISVDINILFVEFLLNLSSFFIIFIWVKSIFILFDFLRRRI
jgi:hypothetical protein